MFSGKKAALADKAVCAARTPIDPVAPKNEPARAGEERASGLVYFDEVIRGSA